MQFPEVVKFMKGNVYIYFQNQANILNKIFATAASKLPQTDKEIEQLVT